MFDGFDKEKLAEALSSVISKSLENLGDDAKKLPWFSSSIYHDVTEMKVTDN